MENDPMTYMAFCELCGKETPQTYEYSIGCERCFDFYQRRGYKLITEDDIRAFIKFRFGEGTFFVNRLAYTVLFLLPRNARDINIEEMMNFKQVTIHYIVFKYYNLWKPFLKELNG